MAVKYQFLGVLVPPHFRLVPLSLVALAKALPVFNRNIYFMAVNATTFICFFSTDWALVCSFYLFI